MTIVFRNADSRFPFFWEDDRQPSARWHRAEEGPAQYVADTPDGAWAEFLRHEEITEPSDLSGIERAIWALEIPDDDLVEARSVDGPQAVGGLASYEECQRIARIARDAGAAVLRAPSAALISGGARGQRTEGGALVEGDARDGVVWVIFGRRPDVRGWQIVDAGRPPRRVLELVRPLRD